MPISLGNFQRFKDKVAQAKGRRAGLMSDIVKLEDKVEQLNEQIINTTEAHTIIRTVAQQTQQSLEFHINSIVYAALSIMKEPYEFQAIFTPKRGKTEMEMFFVRNDEAFDPLEDSGGGAIDLASLALRMVVLSLSPQYAKVIIIDEPFHNLSQGLHEPVSKLLTELSSKLGIQLIIVTHNTTIADHADNKIVVENGCIV